MATAEELRRLREEQSIFSALYDMARQQRSELAAEGRRPVFGGLLSKEPTYGTDTLRYEGIRDMLVGLLTPAAKAVDAPISAMRGTIPQEDMISEALGVGGLAMAGGGAVGVPRGAVGANALRGDKFFAQDEIDIYTRQARNPKSRETLTYMSPQDFLALAKKTTAGEKTEKTRKLLREGTQFESIPFLSVQNQGGGNAKVVGHEGRNRMMALAEAGVESVPVRLNMTGGGGGPSIRWGEALDPNSFDYVDPKDIPVRVINEDENMVYSMPDSVVSPITQAASPSSDLLPLGGYRKPERRLSKEEQDIEDQISESILFDFLRDYDPTAMANASKSAGLLTAASGRGPKKEELDPLGYQKPKMRGYLSDTDVQMSDTSENLPRQPMSWEDMEGKVVLPFYGDRTARGLLVEGVNDLKFDEPVYTEGGVDFMRGPAAQQDRAIWASNQNIIKRIESEAEKASRDFEGADIFGLTGSMSPDANDFATFTGAAMAELVKGAKITKKSAKEFDKVMRAIDPDFVGVLSPKLREWVTSTSSPKRKSFIRLMESAPMQEQGFPSPAEARYSVTDPTQRDMPAGMFGLGAAKVDTSAPLMYNEPKGNLPRANVPHSTYNTQIVGDYVGSLPPVPQGLLFRNVYDAMEGKTTKSGQALNEAHKTHAIKTIMPAQQITPEVLEGILDYLSRMER